jgi:SAM-dependent methyltransferase
VFSRGLKKNLKLRLLQEHVGDVSNQRCLLVTCGDNNGALNHYFREGSGTWTWADIAEHGVEAIREMEELLGEQVHVVEPDSLPFPDEYFDCVVVIDVHEHLSNAEPFTAELFRIVARGGRAIVTVPNGDPKKPVTIIKDLVGMTKEKYGHMRIGYTLSQLSTLMSRSGFVPCATGSYSKFFTEMLELVINFAYVKMLSKKHKTVKVEEGTIAPSSGEQLNAISGSYGLYARVFPLIKAISKLDRLILFGTGYAVMVEARRP